MKKTIILLSFVAVCILLSTSYAIEKPPISPIDTERSRAQSVVRKILPDLTVTAIFFDQDCNLNYTIKNIGGELTETNIPVMLEDKDRIRVSTIVLAGKVKNAGGQETFKWVTGVHVSQSPFIILVNPGNTITESNYENNSLKTKKGLQCGTSSPTIIPGAPLKR